MAKRRFTRGKLLCAAAPLAAVPLVGRLAFDSDAAAGGHDHSSHDHSSHNDSRELTSHQHGAMGHEIEMLAVMVRYHRA